jgi:hypothetical protein
MVEGVWYHWLCLSNGFSNSFCCCCNDRVGGRVSVYVKNSIYAKRRKDLEVSEIECVWIELSLSGKKFLHGTFNNISVWKDIDYPIDLAYNTKIRNIVNVYDFNAKFLTDNLKSSHLLNIKYTYNINQHIDETTRFAEYFHSLIDIIMVSDTSIVRKTFVGDCFFKPTL